jgi:glycerol-3-phosphate cytidylyltransferase/D-beta-D-heptose 7-phosphate kinase/D-beta-D-heptose 1-phosphate adenosyltransferase
MKVVIISGYFNPLHGGHLDMIEAAAKMGDRLVVIVNNDKQQLLKKGKIILDEENRVRLIRALRDVDEVVLSIDEDPAVIKTLEFVAKQYHGEELVFAQGGDRDSDKVNPEADICKRYGISIVYGVGTDIRGLVKPDSSTRINQELGLQD